jgi:hypothetical protein
MGRDGAQGFAQPEGEAALSENVGLRGASKPVLVTSDAGTMIHT